ncbi:MAG: ribosomal L7Ae/L30e/S12e/Gadd45 family protein [Firmicutes bacterium]|nr:ribosomal L7Ae/L30e/S12e/Gadd45 family protein [Bacillota bacterium]
MDRLLGTLGLCMKAGKLVTGEDSVLKAIRGNKAKVVILAKDASANTTKRMTNAATFYNVPLVVYSTKADIGAALGKNIRAVAAVIDEGFGAKIIKTVEDAQTE